MLIAILVLVALFVVLPLVIEAPKVAQKYRAMKRNATTSTN